MSSLLKSFVNNQVNHRHSPSYFLEVKIQNAMTFEDLLKVLEEEFKDQFKEQKTPCDINKCAYSKSSVFRFDLSSGEIFSLLIKVESRNFMDHKDFSKFRIGCTSELTGVPPSCSGSMQSPKTMYFGAKCVFTVNAITKSGTSNLLEKFVWRQPILYRFDEHSNWDDVIALSKTHHATQLANRTSSIVDFVHHIIRRNLGLGEVKNG